MIEKQHVAYLMRTDWELGGIGEGGKHTEKNAGGH